MNTNPHGLRALSAIVVLVAFGATTTFADHPSAALGIGNSGPIGVGNSTPLPAGRTGISLRGEHIDLDRYSDEELEAFDAMGIHAHSVDSAQLFRLSLAHGITDDFSLFAQLPWIHRESVREVHDEGMGPEVENEGDPEGLGDLSVDALYRVLREDSSPIELSLLGGVKFPTGVTDEKTHEGEKFGVEHQPGSGSFDYSLGAAATKTLGRAEIHASVEGTITTEGSQDTELGDRIDWGIGASTVVVGGRHGHASDGAVTPTGISVELVLELIGEHVGKQEIAGVTDRNSGGDLILLSPGFRVSGGGSWSLFGSVGIPILDDPNGAEHETDLRLLFGVSTTF